MQKIIAIWIISIFFLTSLTSTSVANIGDDFSYDNEVIKQRGAKVKSSLPTSFNMFVSNFIGWWSPPPTGSDKAGALCFKVEIDYTGYYEPIADYYTYSSVYGIYDTGDQLLCSDIDHYGKGLLPWFIWTVSISLEEKPISLRIEFDTDYPGENPTDNIEIVNVGLGITIEGYVYTKNLFGNKKVEMANVRCLADDSFFDMCYYETLILAEDEGYYRIFAPLNSETPPCTYNVEVNYQQEDGTRLGSKTQKSKPLNEFEITTMDFVFNRQIKKAALLIKNFLGCMLEQYPVLFSILKYLLKL